MGDLVLYSERREPTRNRLSSWAPEDLAQDARAQLSRALEALAEQDRALERLHFLVEASKTLNSTLDLFELLAIILKMTREQTGAERATLFVVDAERRELWSVVAEGLDKKEIRLPMGSGLAGSVALTGDIIHLADAYADPRFDRRFDQLFGYRTRSILVVPVRDRSQRIVGVLELLNKPSGFGQADIDFLESISVHAAIALDNARLHRESLERQRLDRELALARTIQEGLLPDRPPALPGLDIAVRHSTCLYVGGDYYDFLPVGANTQLFVIADVEGKGVSSALVMSNLQANLRSVVKYVHSLEGMMFDLNEALYQSTRGGKYMTLFLGLLDVPSRGLHYINAGHLPPLVLRANGAIPLREGGTVIGLFPNMRYTRGFVQLQPGDVLVACTDGITESANARDELYGTERLAGVGAAYRARSAQEIVDAIFSDVLAYSDGGANRDDQVVMAIKAT